MSNSTRLPVVTALIALGTVLPTTAFAQVTMRTPVKPVTPIAQTAPLPATPALSLVNTMLHSGPYRLKIHVLPGGDEPVDIQRETDVIVTVNGASVTINGSSPASGTAALIGTIASNQFTATGSDGAMHLTIAGTGTAAGVAGTLTVGSGSKTAHGTFNLAIAPPSLLHKVKEFGSTPAPAPVQGGGFWGWWDGLFNW
jgi:hypothetical protein